MLTSTNQRNMSNTLNECWVWHGAHDRQGYGIKKARKNDPRHPKQLRLHRIAYEWAFGPIPSGQCVCHHCDNPPCCNPNHLFLGTLADNVRDKVQKNRQNAPRGEKHGGAKLTSEQVKEIRASDEPQKVLMDRYRICRVTVWKIKSGLAWKTVDA